MVMSNRSLDSLFVSDELVGMARQEFSPDGLLDIYEAALDDADPTTALARLRGHDFVSGAVRTWTDGTRLAQVTLHRFATPRGAELAALEHAHDLLASAGVRFMVDDVDQYAFGASVRDLQSDFTAHVGVLALHCVRIVALVGGPNTSENDVIRVLREQRSLLRPFVE
jgi:hypothetical protein